MTPTPATGNTHIYGNSTSQPSVFDKIWLSPLDQKILAATTCLAFPLVGSGLFSKNEKTQIFCGLSVLTLLCTTWAVATQPKLLNPPSISKGASNETMLTAAALIYGIGFSGKLPEESPVPAQIGCVLGGTLFMYSVARMSVPEFVVHPSEKPLGLIAVAHQVTAASMVGVLAYKGIPGLVNSIQRR
jgi:hypothetical protein